VSRVARPCMEAEVAVALRPALAEHPFMEDRVARDRLAQGSYQVVVVVVVYPVAVGVAHPAESASPSFKALNLKISNARTL